MSQTLAIVPAKRNSTEVPDKNWKPIAPDGMNCVALAKHVAFHSCDRTVITTDHDKADGVMSSRRQSGLTERWDEREHLTIVGRPDGLCTPEASMLDVIRHALSVVPGPNDEIIVLLQPTSPLRTVETVKKAIQMLEEAGTAAHSVVSVSPSYPLEWSMTISAGELEDHNGGCIGAFPARRQDCKPTYKRDGVVYAFRRTSPAIWGDIYGAVALPLHTPPAESLSIDTPEDWDEAVRRLKERG